jgi:hypothetical protein
MAIHALLKQESAVATTAFRPDDVKALVAAFEDACNRLKVDDPQSAMAFLIARSIIQIGKEGERNPKRLSERVIALYRKPTVEPPTS